MPIDTAEPSSPGWWLDRLARKLAAKRPHYDMLESYYDGTNGIPAHADRAVRDAYKRLMRMARTNFAELVVEAVRERMQPVAFRTGADGDDLGDAEAWRIWQANSLDADHALVERDSLSMGMSYVIVGGVEEDIGAPLITPEDPREVIVEHVAGRRRKAAAALKIYRDDIAGEDRAVLYLPGTVYKAARKATEGSTVDQPGAGWEWTDQNPLPAGSENVVPVVAFPNRADRAGHAAAEFEAHLPILDRINYSILNRLEIATLQAFRQRAIKGKLPTHDASGNEIDYNELFGPGPGALWNLGETAEIWESGTVDLGPLRAAIRDDVQDLAAVTRTPLFYLTPDAANGSAEGASLAREGLVFKTQDRINQLTESWEQVMSLAFRFAGDAKRARRGDMEVLWQPPERFSLAERYDAAAKAQAAGVPWRSIMADILQFSPQQVQRMEAERAGDLLLSASLATREGQSAPAVDPIDIKARADAMGVLVRSGATLESAASQVGLEGVEFREGAVPVTIRLPEDQ